MNELTILWTNADIVTFDKMVAMYAKNAMLHHWWEKVTLLIWGATAKLSAESDIVEQRFLEMKQLGIRLVACKGCADQLNVTQRLEEMGVEVIYTGEMLTSLLKEDKKLLTI
jgi:hypothetical protein